MKSKTQKTFNLKFLLLLIFLIFLFCFLSKSSSFSSPSEDINSSPSCTKIPPSLENAVIYYATLNTTPQQTIGEISIASQVLQRKSPCNFLVFGLGYDSLMWSALNHGGRTVFLEEDEKWIETVRQRLPAAAAETYHVKYDTRVSEAEQLLELGRRPPCTALVDVRDSECRLALRELPRVFYEVEWDVIMVDAPTGFNGAAPGRMAAIYTAGMVARWRKEGETDVFVHDVDRIVEDRFSREFLCEGYKKHEEGRLRHFTIPSHRANVDAPICPS
ncbi:glucuronoxylan 4-O-methyltransferase 2-like [Canna indica]|uniref:Glucuronoxylan 4-O-methyltransferase 2-like n=1 Tax=Canna indica TaxID=4628 RepID=A0AAQ3QCG7_9LILI|nr:glucuronoxylan 4-O-methyltransferase 2-like [Canna indica]